MRDVSLFLLKNSLGLKMKKGLRNFCNDDGSTSILNQHTSPVGTVNVESGCNKHWQNTAAQHGPQEMERQPTLEEMILKLDLEEEIARKSKALQLLKQVREDDDHYNVDMNGLIVRGPGRMSCVNNSDILRSARNALNQYPRFSLDGRDAMYRSSFRNSLHLQNDHIAMVGKERPRRPAHRDHRRSSDVGTSTSHEYFDASSNTTRTLYCRHLPATLAGESVVWCKPGVVAKLMGLDAVPVPVSVGGKFKGNNNENKLHYILNHRQVGQRNMITVRSGGDQRREMEKRSTTMHAIDHNNPKARNCSRVNKKGKEAAAADTSSCSTTSKTTAAGKYCVMKPLATIQHSDHN